MKITSVNNELIKETAKLLKSKHRNETGLFIIEGFKGIEEALSSGVEIEKIFICQNEIIDNEILKQVKNDIIIEVTDTVISKISDAKSAPKAVAVAKQLSPKWSDNYKKVILLEGIKDPGNLGTILRTAAAFNIDAVVLYGDTVDLYNPKTVRSAVGNLWKIPVFKFDNLDKFKDYECYATLPSGENSIKLNDYRPAGKTVIMFGSEADGLSENLKNFATKNLTIEMSENVESLNLSVSAAIVMYELNK